MEKYKMKSDKSYTIDQVAEGIFDDIQSFAPTFHIGGSITNTLRVFRKITNRKVFYLGAIGKDSFGQKIKHQLTKEGIHFHFSELDNANTGKVAVIIFGTSRTLVTDLGASRHFSLETLREVGNRVENTKLIYFSAFFIPVCYTGLRQIIIEKVEKNKKQIIALNLGAPFLCSNYRQQMVYLYQNSDLVFCNKNEFLAFAEVNQIVGSDFKEILSKTHHFYRKRCTSHSQIVVVTNGEKDIVTISGENKIEEFQVENVAKDKIVDTNGAGDAFVAGFLALFIVGQDICKCVRNGVSVAQRTLQGVGCESIFKDT